MCDIASAFEKQEKGSLLHKNDGDMREEIRKQTNEKGVFVPFFTCNACLTKSGIIKSIVVMMAFKVLCSYFLHSYFCQFNYANKMQS